MRAPEITDARCRLVAETPSDHQHYFGFHDVSPWSPDNERIALLRVPLDLKTIPIATDEAEICIWAPGNRVLQPVGRTNAFNWQQGARLQWVPGQNQTLMVNDLVDSVPVTRFLDLALGTWSPPIPAVYSVHPSGAFGLAPDWFRLATWWRDYSYDLPHHGRQKLGERGDLRRVDLATGQERVIVPIAEVRALCGTGVDTESDFISHATFSPQGSRFCFMYRRFTEDRALFSFFLVCNSDGSQLRVLAKEKCSHFDWIDEDRLIIWTRNLPSQMSALRARGITKRFPFKQMVKVLRRLGSETKQRLFAESYYEVDYREPGKMTPIGSGVLEQDGHPMFTPDRRWMVTDTYVSDGVQPLIFFDLTSSERHDIARFPAHPDFVGRLKCDLHPRLDRPGKQVAVDSAHSGFRQMYIVDTGALTD